MPTSTASFGNYDKEVSVSHISLILDATCLRSWRDTSEYAAGHYYAMDLKIHSFRSSDNIMLARYTGGKLKKDALYQIRGRYFIDMSKDGRQSYLHIDEAIRFQGPGTLKSFRKPTFLAIGEPMQVFDTQVTMRWVTQDDYRRNMVYEQNAVFRLEAGIDDAGRYVNRECYLEGWMDGLDHRRDWVASDLRLC